MSPQDRSSHQNGNRLEASEWIQRGDRLLKEKKISEAVEVYSEAVKIQPNSALHHSKLGNALLRLKQFDRAERCFQQAVTLSPQSHMGLYGLAQVAAGKEQWEDAIARYRYVIELKPGFLAAVYQDLGVILSRQAKWVEAADAFRQVIQMNSKAHLAHYGLGKVLEQLEQLDEAIAAFKTSIQLDPNFSDAQEGLGSVLARQTQLSQAENQEESFFQIGQGSNHEDLEPEDASLLDIERQLIAKHPLPHKIFLPTQKISVENRVEGLKRVLNIYEDKWEKYYKPKLSELREQYKGTKRAFIIGNGPSLNLTDLDLLKDEITFGVNGIFLKSKDTGFIPTFYVVEDHLVAEDRQESINSFKGSTKLFPINLAYCIEESEDTIFFNHRPRKSYPDGYDFSMNALDCTYAGCTVTFTCMQLAYFLGFQEIYLVGVDASYAIPEDIKINKEYSVETLDMESDDINHFHPDYFGKGYRWHDPQVHKMKLAYQEARRVCNETGVDIYNATIGGKLEVFPRINYYSLFSLNKVYPRILIIDKTRIGSISATGQIKKNLFSGWPPGNILQLFAEGENDFRLFSESEILLKQGEVLTQDEILEECKRFNPSIVYYRPIPDLATFHIFACQMIDELGKPIVTHVMDDWPDRLAIRNSQLYQAWNYSLCAILDKSFACLSISTAMSEAFQERYGIEFHPFSNCVEVENWPEKYYPSSDSLNQFVIRYVGSLAEDMTCTSIFDIASIISELQSEFSVRLEIYTTKPWLAQANQKFSHLSCVFVYEANFTDVGYRELLCTADLLILAYNFDESSIRYVKYSMANKLPECLASGVPLLVYGPITVATVAYAATIEAVQLVTEPNHPKLKSALREIIQSSELRQTLGKKARQYAFEHHNAKDVRPRLYNILRQASNSGSSSHDLMTKVALLQITAGYHRREHAHFDETSLVFELLKDRPNASVMIDVGAHTGTALKSFAHKGWQIFAFEPDPSNREKLISTIGNFPNVKVDPRAVSDRILENVSFFTSKESTGVSTLNPFLESHEERCMVSTTTLTKLFEVEPISRVDFLKIDTEGHDLMVLKGVPWDKVRPDIIECEFEDSKTVPLGYTFHDLANYLVDHGYTLLVSEWHPIIRYGIKHDWHRLLTYPCQLADPFAWGNVIAFKVPPDLHTVAQSTHKVLKIRL